MFIESVRPRMVHDVFAATDMCGIVVDSVDWSYYTIDNNGDFLSLPADTDVGDHSIAG